MIREATDEHAVGKQRIVTMYVLSASDMCGRTITSVVGGVFVLTVLGLMDETAESTFLCWQDVLIPWTKTVTENCRQSSLENETVNAHCQPQSTRISLSTALVGKNRCGTRDRRYRCCDNGAAE